MARQIQRASPDAALGADAFYATSTRAFALGLYTTKAIGGFGVTPAARFRATGTCNVGFLA